MDRFEAMSLFVEVVESGSFSAASQRTGVPVSTISRKVAALENLLSTRLLNRNTRTLSVTEAGAAYHSHSKRILADLADGVAALNAQTGSVSGLLRITAPAILGRMVISPIVAAFLRRHPQASAELSLNDRVVDLVGEGFDVAVRTGPLEETRLVARRLGSFRRILCCSPGFLSEVGPIETLEQMRPEHCLTFTHVARHGRWRLVHKGGEQSILAINGRLKSDSADALYTAAMEGMGIILTPTWQAAADIARGALVQILPDYSSEPSPIHALFADAKLLSPKVRAFIDGATVWFQSSSSFAH